MEGMIDLSVYTQRKPWQREDRMMEGKRGGKRLHGRKIDLLDGT